MTGAVEKVAAALQAVHIAAIEGDWIPEFAALELAEAAIAALRDAGWTDPDETKRLRDDRDFWKDQQKFAANVAATIADLDEEAPALRQLLRGEIERRKQAERDLTKAEYAAQTATARAEAAEVRNAAALAYCAYAEQCGTKAAATLGGLIREVLGGETATTQTPEVLEPVSADTIASARAVTSFVGGPGIDIPEFDDEGPAKGSSDAVEPRSGGERESGKVADSDTAERQEAS